MSRRLFNESAIGETTTTISPEVKGATVCQMTALIDKDEALTSYRFDEWSVVDTTAIDHSK